MTEGSSIQKSRTARSVRQKRFRLLLPLASLEESRLLLPLAEVLVKAHQGQLLILHILEVEEDQPRSEVASQASEFREALNKLIKSTIRISAWVRTKVQTANEAWDGIWEAVKEEEADLLLLAWRTPGLEMTVVKELVHPLLAEPPCAVVAVRPPSIPIASIDWHRINSILLPVRGGINSTLTLRLGYNLAQQTHASITLLHVDQPQMPGDEIQFADAFHPVVRGLEQIGRTITCTGEVPPAIIREARNHQVVVMGAPSQSTLPEAWHGPVLDTVMDAVDSTIIIAKERSQTSETIRRGMEPASKAVDRPVAVVVDRWFAENTFQSREFTDLERLLVLKEEQEVTISLGLPALNEQETVGSVIQTIKTALMDDIPILDEIVLIDSGSKDDTRKIAADLGIPVYIHQEILPECGVYHGKGEALWKSLYVMSGDILAWIDTDIKNIHPRFVYGILGPLLRVPHIQYVKGFYRRPLREGDKILAGGGGRVTELTARPFINLFFPELSGLIQPLSGEYAGRRSALERMPFPTGYGVETGLLLDLLEEFGLGAIAQVDLLERIHHNQPLASLSKMSFAIMQVVFRRLEKRYQMRMLVEANRTMNLIRYGNRRRYYLEPEEICEEERPPMITLPQYRERRNLFNPPIGDLNSGGDLHR
jgi:nucleotide-binding universal stress UspA family protein